MTPSTKQEAERERVAKLSGVHDAEYQAAWARTLDAFLAWDYYKDGWRDCMEKYAPPAADIPAQTGIAQGAPASAQGDASVYQTEAERKAWSDGMTEAQELLADEIRNAVRYEWLRDDSGKDVRSLLGVGDFTTMDAFIDAAILVQREREKT